jgi:hypothetical protein
MGLRGLALCLLASWFSSGIGCVFWEFILFIDNKGCFEFLGGLEYFERVRVGVRCLFSSIVLEDLLLVGGLRRDPFESWVFMYRKELNFVF